MDLILALLFSFAMLLFSIIKGYFIAYPLLLSLGLFTVVLMRRGFPLKALMVMGFASSQKSFAVLSILLLIGAVTAIWIAAGTVPALVYYGIQLLNPQYFILSAFILTSLVSMLLGTSFGTVGTIGIALMIVAKEGNINLHLTSGAIIAGAYLGDRCSPMSSSANLVASLTGTKLYKNIRNMLMTAWLPLMASILLYWLFSINNPVQINAENLISKIPIFFTLSFWALLPALVILVLAILKIDVRISLLLSVVAGVAIGVLLQNYSLLQLLKVALLGFNLESKTDLDIILTGGGIVSMVRVTVVVLLSTTLAGIIAGTRTLAVVDSLLKKASSRSHLFFITTLVSLASAAFGCTQTIAIIMTQQLVKEKYEQERLNNYQLATDIENTAVVLAPLIPWNIAGLVPANILMTDSGYIPYAFYLYLIPLFHWMLLKLAKSRGVKLF
ncbi:MAG: Na+/H+ antiporter NhaC family protein [Coleofasciculus sp. S288]|nr:Na+/H+ antiporter NhaC family protein [Coleofasciculus sp. S288]